MLAIGRTWIGVVVAIVGNVTISLALNCQKLAHMRLQKYHQGRNDESDQQGDEQANDPSQSNRHAAQNGHVHTQDSAEAQNAPIKQQNGHTSVGEADSSSEQNGNGMDTEFLHSKLWWLGLALMTIGEAGNFISYGFAPASLVAPLGAVALLSNVIISPILLGERFRPSDIGGILLAIIGAVTVVFSSKQSDVRLNPDQLLKAIKRLEFVIYTAISIFLGMLTAFVSNTSFGDRWVLIDVGTCAIFGGFTVLSTKGISSLISGGQPIEALRFPITYALVVVLAVTAVIQITYLNRALQRFDSREVIPTQFVLFTISAIVGSAILYRDFENMDAHRLINFLFGCLTTFAGVFVFTWRQNGSGADEGQDAQHSFQDESEGVEAADEENEATGPEDAEGRPLLAHSWHGRERGRNASHQATKSRQRLDFLEPVPGEAPRSDALRVPGKNKIPSPAGRPRSRTNSPHNKSSRLSGSFDRSSGFSRSATNQGGAGLLSSSSDARMRTPRLSLIGMDRPTGLSSGHYLLLANPPSSFTLNPVASAPSNPQRSGLNRGLTSQYSAIGSRSGPSAFLPFPVTMASGSGSGTGSQQAIRSVSAQSNITQQAQQDMLPPASAPTAAETLATPVADTTPTPGSEKLTSRLSEQVTQGWSQSDSVSGPSASKSK